MPVPTVISEADQEIFDQGIATRYYRAGLRFQPFIIVGDKFQSLGIFKTVEAARSQRVAYLESFNAIVSQYVGSPALAYFRAVDRGEQVDEPDEAD